MEPISADGVPPATQDRGGQPLEFRVEDDVKVFEVTAQLDALWTYGGHKGPKGGASKATNKANSGAAP